jgi:FtsP/CotA-like multicopper oxidase with cupredoxin domain
MLTAPTLMNHPFHLHGYQLYVMAMGQHPENIPMTLSIAKKMISVDGFWSYSKTKKHALKDTISIPPKGYIILRFKADNPGWWLVHCHYGNEQNIFENHLN